ncbi:MAG TPA: hypothetical protein ACFYD6_04720 [Candidatus Brocadiia bacterium]|nr:hypothetical protein [Planctomycetota bacterium]MDO8092872.1 hypothetical protein [Candidatus Brocadiales bacterium]
MAVIGEDVYNIINHLVKEGDLNSKICKILEKEIRRRITEYELIDRGFQKKYGMPLKEFEKNEVIKQKGYSFEVESDYYDWDATVDAIDMLKEDLKKLCQKA